jgi:L-ascorbate metabolism protein UlaG (beta-lactamase superfamily)
MQLTKFGHACVRLEKDGRRLVIDPGGLTSDDALADAAAVLVTHEHFDHFVAGKLRAAAAANPGLEIWTNASVAGQLDGPVGRVHVVGHGDVFTAAGFDVRVHGEWHAVVHPDIPIVANVGFFVDNLLFHPGDALTVPGEPVDTLMLPVHGPWSRVGELIDWVREVRPSRTIAIHDGALNEVGLAIVGGLLGDRGPGTGAPYTRLEPTEQAELG